MVDVADEVYDMTQADHDFIEAFLNEQSSEIPAPESDPFNQSCTSS